MGKRNAIVISSSDDEDSVVSLSSGSSFFKSKSKLSSVSRTVPRRRTKKARITNPSSQPCKESNPFDQIKLFCEELDEGFNGLKVSSGCRMSSKDLWVDKYEPRFLEELAIHRKKVEELKFWFEQRLNGKMEEFHDYVLLITGQAGVGKSVTVHVIASHLGATVCEWKTPTPTIWREHLLNSNSGIQYMSKLDEFENFVEKIRKYGLVAPSFSGESKKSVILLIDDLPVISGKVSYERLNRSLHLLLQSVRKPTAILITDYGKSDSADYSTRCWEEIQSSLQSAGARKVAFNPITVNSIKKILSKISREEQCNMTAEQIDLVAKASGGDIRHAITSFQFFSLKSEPAHCSSFSNGTYIHTEDGRLDEISCLDHGFSLPFGRDETLSLFHALGKFLHNKRDVETSTDSDKNVNLLRDRFVRLPLKMDTPEKVLCQAHGEARHVVDFLHENVLDFMNEEAIEDAWVVASYLSDADLLLASSVGMLTRTVEAENVVQSTAASVAARGVLFGNSQPLSSRWHAIRRPNLWQVERSFFHNKCEMVRQRNLAYDGLNLSNLSVNATEWRPAYKWLGFRAPEHKIQEIDVLEDGDIIRTSADDKENEISDDEIEDC